MERLKKWSSWAENIWETLGENWECEIKHNYKELFVSRELNKVLNKLRISKSHLTEKKTLKIVDFGCGDGIMTGLFLEILSKHFPKSQFEVTCIELSEQFLKCTEKNLERKGLNNIKKIYTVEADISKPLEIGKFDVIFSSFVIHNIANWLTTLENFCINAETNSLHIHVFLCPLFVEILRHKKVIILMDEEELWKEDSIVWRYVAKYPIIGDKGGRTYFPYFHRFVGDYISAFLKIGISLANFSYHTPRDKNLLTIPPFYSSEDNLLYPEIWSYPSLNILVGRKQAQEGVNGLQRNH